MVAADESGDCVQDTPVLTFYKCLYRPTRGRTILRPRCGEIDGRRGLGSAGVSVTDTLEDAWQTASLHRASVCEAKDDCSPIWIRALQSSEWKN